jgi:acetyltransferase-like isoleucine patch superfamily enzyme
MAFFDRLYMHSYHRFWKKHLLERLQKKPKALTVMGQLNLGTAQLTIGENCCLGSNVSLFGTANGHIALADGVFLGDGVKIDSGECIKIGEKTIIAGGTFITDINHGMALGKVISEQPIDTQPTLIGKGVWIGANVVVLKGSIIHDGAVIGAGAVVNGEIPENAIAVGVPAKMIRYRK